MKFNRHLKGLIVDVWGCEPSQLNDTTYLRGIMEEVASAIDATVVKKAEHAYIP